MMDCNLVILFLFIFNVVHAKDISLASASEYLLNYGYADKDRRLAAMPSGEIERPVIKLGDALIKFQKFAGLPTTGQLDSATKQKMVQPRCGVADVLLLTREQLYKWPKRDLTYSIDEYPANPPAEDIRQSLAQAFSVWSAVTPLRFRQVSSGGEIVIKFARRRHGDPWPFDGRGGVLAHATLPTSGMLHFDLDEKWVYMDPEKISRYDSTDLLAVAIHEIGHVLGLEHSKESDSVMAPFYQDTVDRNGNYKMPKLSASDIRNIQEIYGPPGNAPSGGNRGSAGRGGGRSRDGDDAGVGRSGNGIWDRLKGMFGFGFGSASSSSSAPSTDNHPSTANQPSPSDSDHDGDDDKIDIDNSDRDNGGSTWNGACPNEVDAITTVNGIRYLFNNDKVYELGPGAGSILRMQSLRRLFPNGPPFVQAALSSPRSGKTLLFHDRKVYRYTLDKLTQSFTLERGFPKRLPSDLSFKPMGAFVWTDGQQIIVNGIDFATYDDDYNAVTLQNKVLNYFDNFPNRPIRGLIINRNKIILFGNSEVYKYNRKRNTIIGNAVPLKVYLHCSS